MYAILIFNLENVYTYAFHTAFCFTRSALGIGFPHSPLSHSFFSRIQLDLCKLFTKNMCFAWWTNVCIYYVCRACLPNTLCSCGGARDVPFCYRSREGIWSVHYGPGCRQAVKKMCEEMRGQLDSLRFACIARDMQLRAVSHRLLLVVVVAMARCDHHAVCPHKVNARHVCEAMCIVMHSSTNERAFSGESQLGHCIINIYEIGFTI